MNFRNAAYNRYGSIDVEFEHPELGWIPFTASPDDEVETGRLLHAAVVASGNVAPYAPPPVTSREVDRERDRRIGSGFTFAGTIFQSRAEDRENIAGAASAALAAIVGGSQPGDLRWHGGDSDFAWIAEDNSLHTMDAQTMFAFGQAAMQHKQSHIFAARALKDSDPIPPDYEDDGYWP